MNTKTDTDIVSNNAVDNNPLKDSVKEVFYSLVISTSPVWLSAFITSFFITKGDVSYSAAIMELIIKGDLFIYSTTLLAPVYWLIYKKRVLGIPDFVVSLMLLVVLISVVSYSMTNVGMLPTKNTTIILSLILLIFSIIGLSWVAFLHNKLPLNPGEVMTKETGEFVKDYAEHKLENSQSKLNDYSNYRKKMDGDE